MGWQEDKNQGDLDNLVAVMDAVESATFQRWAKNWDRKERNEDDPLSYVKHITTAINTMGAEGFANMLNDATYGKERMFDIPPDKRVDIGLPKKRGFYCAYCEPVAGGVKFYAGNDELNGKTFAVSARVAGEMYLVGAVRFSTDKQGRIKRIHYDFHNGVINEVTLYLYAAGHNAVRKEREREIYGSCEDDDTEHPATF